MKGKAAISDISTETIPYNAVVDKNRRGLL
jgi:hypothetical protein